MAKQTLGSCRRSLVVRELVMGTHPVDPILSWPEVGCDSGGWRTIGRT